MNARAGWIHAEELFDGMLIPKTRAALIPNTWTIDPKKLIDFAKLEGLHCLMEKRNGAICLMIDTFTKKKAGLVMLSSRIPWQHEIYTFKCWDFAKAR